MSKGTVLVVDDAPGIVYILQTILEQAGYRVVTGVSGSVQQLAREVQPNVILLDIMMPGLDGIALASCLQTDPATAGIPVNAISALDYLKLRMKAVKMRAVDCLSKPFELDEVLLRVEKWGTASPRA